MGCSNQTDNASQRFCLPWAGSVRRKIGKPVGNDFQRYRCRAQASLDVRGIAVIDKRHENGVGFQAPKKTQIGFGEAFRSAIKRENGKRVGDWRSKQRRPNIGRRITAASKGVQFRLVFRQGFQFDSHRRLGIETLAPLATTGGPALNGESVCWTSC